MDNSLSLWTIEAELAELIDRREEASAIDDNEERHNVQELIDFNIQTYIEREVRKVDGIRGYLRHADTMAAAAKAEAQAQSERAKRWEDRSRRVKAFVASVMDAHGIKKLDGQTGTLQLKGNGGKQPVTITDPTTLPPNLVEVQVTMTAEGWDWLSAMAAESNDESAPRFTARVSPPIPKLDRIREELELPCPRCKNHPGADWNNSASVACTACGGTARNGVPGAVLEERGKHVEVR